MKIRSGFVSNSSSSSFIVRRGDVIDKKKLITSQQDAVLKKYGFRKTMMISSDAVPPFYDEAAWIKEDRRVEMESDPRFRWNWCYEITCNQDEVVMFLIENKIPFTASIHYGHYTWIYTPELNRLIIATNLGRIIEMYGDMEDSETSKVKEILKASEWLAKEKKFWEKQVK
jgi:hypothetical protein